MIYVNNNKKLADLLETLLKPEKVTNVEINEAEELISELRSHRADIVLAPRVSNCDDYR